MENNNQESFNFIFTSLSIILLAIFLYFNSIAQISDTKKNKVVKAVSEVFGLSIQNAVEVPKDLSPDFLLPYLEGSSTNAGENVSISSVKDQLIISLKADYLFRPGDEQLRAEQLPVLSTLVSYAINNNLRTDIRYSFSKTNPTISDWLLQTEQTAAVLRYFIDSKYPALRIQATTGIQAATEIHQPAEQVNHEGDLIIITFSRLSAQEKSNEEIISGEML